MKQHGNILVVLILFLSAFTLVSAGFAVLHEMARQQAEPSQRVEALLCWHEFQAGRRATTADCPEL